MHATLLYGLYGQVWLDRHLHSVRNYRLTMRPCTFQRGIFLSVLYTGCIFHSTKAINTAQTITLVMPNNYLMLNYTRLPRSAGKGILTRRSLIRDAAPFAAPPEVPLAA